MACRLGGIRGFAQASTGFLCAGSAGGFNNTVAATATIGRPVKPANCDQCRTIVTKWNLNLPYNYPEPWPYKERGFQEFRIIYGRNKERFHVNSRLIVVEGNVACGKTKFAAQLADELGFHHMEEFKMEDIMIDRYGNDFRTFYHLFPKSFRIPDLNIFLKNPADDMTAVMQDRFFDCRWEQYLNALAHIFNTGQGVVLERSPYSDFVFVNAMRQKDWISPEYFNFYYFKRKTGLPYLRLRPHLIIYLDCPAEKCLENVQKRGNPDEINAIDLEYLNIIESSYKDYLRELRPNSFMLTYDWSTPVDIDEVLEDLLQLNLDFYEWHNSADLLADWNFGSDYICGLHRTHVTQKNALRINAFNGLKKLKCEVAELYVYPPDAVHFRNVIMHEVLKDRCTHGFTKNDPVRFDTMNVGYAHSTDADLDMPERWTEYFWKEKHIGMMIPFDRFADPTGKNYNPEYLHHH